MAGTHTETVLNKLPKREVVQLLLNPEVNIGSKTSSLTAEVKKLSSYLKNWRQTYW